MDMHGSTLVYIYVYIYMGVDGNPLLYVVILVDILMVGPPWQAPILVYIYIYIY